MVRPFVHVDGLDERSHGACFLDGTGQDAMGGDLSHVDDGRDGGAERRAWLRTPRSPLGVRTGGWGGGLVTDLSPTWLDTLHNTLRGGGEHGVTPLGGASLPCMCGPLPNWALT